MTSRIIHHYHLIAFTKSVIYIIIYIYMIIYIYTYIIPSVTIYDSSLLGTKCFNRSEPRLRRRILLRFQGLFYFSRHSWNIFIIQRDQWMCAVKVCVQANTNVITTLPHPTPPHERCSVKECVESNYSPPYPTPAHPHPIMFK